WFFGLPAIFFLFSGLFMGNLVIQIFSVTNELAVGYALITVLLLILGAVGLSTGIMLHSILSLLRQYMRTRQ
ncbi:MAG TPA: hypothetical protein VNK95_24930, partial [Caldilineaceae bacterium]|nr:hypothetical protein [Caldilineaceae bacterium]